MWCSHRRHTRAARAACLASIPFTALLVALPASAAPQQDGNLQLAVAAAAAHTSESDVDHDGWGLGLQGRVGFRLGSGFLGLEYSEQHVGGDDELPTIDPAALTLGLQAVPRDLRTRALLLTYELQLADRLHLRPGVGIAGHRFVTVDTNTITFDRSWETGLAAGAALGYDLTDLLRAEAFGRWSGGEDSTSSRRVLGFQLAIVLPR